MTALDGRGHGTERRWFNKGRTVLMAAGLGVVLAAVFFASSGSSQSDGPLSGGTLSGDADLFGPVADVLEHPRCMNCHPRSDIPLQTDLRRVHQMNIQRGPADMGAPGAPCAACHGSANREIAGVPGAPHWQLAPLSMGWQGLGRAELCRALTDPALNGERDLAALVEHMSVDPLVLWGWAPGVDLTPVPVPHSDFVVQLMAWAEAGGPCPD
jgi:hypothetical protein